MIEWKSVSNLPKEQEHPQSFGNSKAVLVYYGDMSLKQRQERCTPFGIDTDIYNHTFNVWMQGVTPTHWAEITLPEPEASDE